MWITAEEAIEIYARYCKARFGRKAANFTRRRAMELRKLGDVEGERIWTAVTCHIEGMSTAPNRGQAPPQAQDRSESRPASA